MSAMASTILLLASFSTAVTAHIGRRYAYEPYPSPSAKVSYTSSSGAVPSSDYSSCISTYPTTLVNSTLSSSLPTSSALISSVNTTAPSLSISSTVASAVLTSTTAANETATSLTVSPTSNATATLSSASSSSSNTTTSTSSAVPTSTCISVLIEDVQGGSSCGCDYNIQTCLERLSNLNEWSNSQTTETFRGCIDACDGEPNCFSFTWQASSGTCWMFGGMLNGGDGVLPDVDFVSGEVIKGTCTGDCVE